MKYKGIIFDLDGVLCSTDRFHFQAWQETARQARAPFDETINQRLRGVSRMESLKIILEGSPLTFTREEKERMARECIPGQGFNTKTINRAAALAVIAYVPGLSGQGDAPLTETQAAGWEMFHAGIAAQTFCLAARDLGIGTCILGIFDADAAGRLLELEGLRPACLIAMGYPEQWKNGPGRKETEELLSFR